MEDNSIAEGKTGATSPVKSEELLERWKLVLWPGHQRLIATATAIGLVLIVAYFSWLAFQSNGLVEIESVPQLEYKFQVDVNQAKWNELFAIPGIGEKLAKRIIDYRNTHGAFVSLDDLESVPGLGKKSVDRFRKYLLPIN